MLRVVACVTQEHQLGLLALAALICALTSIGAFQMLKRAEARRGRVGDAWALASGAAAGIGVWSTHFVAMTAYDVGLPLGFAKWPLAASLVVSLALQMVAFWAMRRAPHWRLKLSAGVLSGVGIVAMHFAGMDGLLSPALVVWDDTLLSASVILCIPLACAAFMFFDGAKPRWHALAPGLILVAAICALHFTAMAALTLVPLRMSIDTMGDVSRSMLGVLVGAAAVLVVLTGLCAALVDAVLFSRERLETTLRARVSARTAEIKAMALRQLELRRRAEAANVAKSRFLANMSHELRTPLNAIIGYTEMVSEELATEMPEHVSRRDLDHVLSSAKHLLSLINEVLDLSKIEAGKVQLAIDEVDAPSMAADVISMIETAYRGARPTISLIVDGDVGAIRTDEKKLRQCLINLASNACKFTPVSGRVQIRIWRTADSGCDFLCVAVSDSGVGIAPDQLQHLFQPFVQIDNATTRKAGGTGLGLVVTRRLAQLMGGDVEAKSILGEGSTFTLFVRADMLEVQFAALPALIVAT